MSSLAYTSSVIVPVVVTDAMLQAGYNVPEPSGTEVLWNAATAYLVGDECIRTATHTKYKRLVAGTTATPPESDFVNWLAVGPTKRWGMFDRKIGTKTERASPLTVVIRPGMIGGLALIGLRGQSLSVTMKDQPGGVTVYSYSATLDNALIDGFYDWLFTDFEQQEQVVLTDLPAHFLGCELTVTVTDPAATCAIGVMIAGSVKPIGATEYGPSTGIRNYSEKTQDQFGFVDVKEGPFANRAKWKVIAGHGDFARIQSTLASIRSTPAVFVGSSLRGYEPLVIYGFFEDFQITIPGPKFLECSLDIEGLT